MSYKDAIASLSDKERIDLAARLTEAALSASGLNLCNDAKTSQRRSSRIAERTLMMFGYFLEHLSSGREPGRFPDQDR